jgi:hypothetical protein
MEPPTPAVEAMIGKEGDHLFHKWLFLQRAAGGLQDAEAVGLQQIDGLLVEHGANRDESLAAS